MVNDVGYWLVQEVQVSDAFLQKSYRRSAWQRVCRFASALKQDEKRKAARAASRAPIAGPPPGVDPILDKLRAAIFDRTPAPASPPLPRGRPATRPPTSLTGILLTDEERARYRAAATARGVSLSEWVRAVCDAATVAK